MNLEIILIVETYQINFQKLNDSQTITILYKITLWVFYDVHNTYTI